MGDKIYEVLSLASKPLPLSDICHQIKVFFPNATKSSIDGSMRLDTRHRFKYDVERHVYVWWINPANHRIPAINGLQD